MFIFRRSLNNEVYYVRSEDNLYISSTIFVIICDISNGIPSLRVLTSSIGNVLVTCVTRGGKEPCRELFTTRHEHFDIW